MHFAWNDQDKQAVTTAKALAADMVENAGSGHPGTPISLAGVAYLLYRDYLVYDVNDPNWIGRDRFVLSAGHASALQYIQLYLNGIGLELDDLKAFRHIDSRTPGHPEFGHTPGIELTTGPLGSGFAGAVGMAMASRREHGIFDPNTALNHGSFVPESPFDHYVYTVAGDGCMQEGITYEAASLAGTQELGNLICIYDDNRITIEDDTSIAFNEDVAKRFEACGWHTQHVQWRKPDGTYEEDEYALARAIDAARDETTKPSLIVLSTIIGWPTPVKQNTGGIHGAKLGTDTIRALKLELGLDPDASFQVPDGLLEYTRRYPAARLAAYRREWDDRFETWAEENPDKLTLLTRIQSGELPPDLDSALPWFEPGKALATRAASGAVINAISPVMPELWGGSADLAGSNNTLVKGAASFFPPERSSKEFNGDYFGVNLHFGVREHAMGGIMNGIAVDGLTRVYGGTFFVFADYMRGSVRLAALMNLPVTYVWTHDSIGVGEDGPTHQPVEHLTAYRAIPNLSIVRPGDADETKYAWKGILERRGPAGLILSRQNLPNPGRGPETGLASAEGTLRGGYVIKDSDGAPDVILMGSGSELQLALAASDTLEKDGIRARVVSMPCMEWFMQQDAEYRQSVLPDEVSARVSVEAGLALPWLPFVGAGGASVSIKTFGAPGAADQLFERFGITAEAVVKAAKKVLSSEA